jgi:Fe-S-cluster-containing hydrogenase component 2
LEARTFHRWLLDDLAPKGLEPLRRKRPLRRVLAYLQPGDIVGEIGSLNQQPRNATCVAYDHPDTGAAQDVPGGGNRGQNSRLLALKIPIADPAEFRRHCPELARRLDRLSATRQEQPAAPPAVLESPEFQQMGLLQGQHLMLIDLQKCTRCNACVEACVDAHDDHRPRLHLDGPRFTFGATPFLAPLTCRQCLDPVCMIPCPVGSILRIDSGAIQITDWCIGCHNCAMACPFGSIQMHETSETERAERSVHFARLIEPGFQLREVTEQAVVCDLCSQSALGQPACVYACPHDATFRQDARITFQRGGSAGQGSGLSGA